MSNHDWEKDPNFAHNDKWIYPHLRSRLLSQHRQLRQAAMKGSKKYIKRGEEGLHVKALQKALNIASHFNRRRWGRLDPDGKFAGKTFAALKACQDFLNWNNRQFALSYARDAGTPGSESFKHIYRENRTRLKSDGIAGPSTLKALDLYIYTHWMPAGQNS